MYLGWYGRIGDDMDIERMCTGDYMGLIHEKKISESAVNRIFHNIVNVFFNSCTYIFGVKYD